MLRDTFFLQCILDKYGTQFFFVSASIRSLGIKFLMYEFLHLISLTFLIGIFCCFAHCKATLLFFRLSFEIYNYLLNSILWKIFCETMDKSKIRAIFNYEFRCGANTSETVRNSIFRIKCGKAYFNARANRDERRGS